MGRNTLRVGWGGEVYDCDCNQQLGMQGRNSEPLFLWDIHPAALEGREIMRANHCFGCTAGCGSSCGGGLLERRPLTLNGFLNPAGPRLGAGANLVRFLRVPQKRTRFPVE